MGASSPLSTDPNPTLIADLDVGGFDLTNVGNVVATGTFTGLQLGDDLDLNNNDIINVVDITAGGNIQVIGNVTANQFNGVHSGPRSGSLTTEAHADLQSGAGYYAVDVLINGNTVTAYISIDLTGLHSEATDGDIIGVDGNANPAYLCRLAAADLGTILDFEIHCTETPAGGDPNIAFYTATEGTGVEDGAIGDLTETAIYDPDGDWAAGTTILKAGLDNLPVADGYLYLVQGDATGTDADYSAGRFVIKVVGALFT